MNEEQIAGCERIGALLQEIGMILSSDNWELDPSDDGVFLNQWVLVCSWTDAEGKGFLSRFFPPTVMEYQARGLLHAGLNWD
jgi:hypothetical protein